MVIKKISALLILAVFLFSLFTAVLAHQEDEPHNESAENNKDVEDKSRSILREGVLKFREETKISEEGARKRVIAKKRFEEARENYLNAREKYLEARMKYHEKIKDIKDEQKEYKRCKNKEDETCKVKVRDFKVNIKEALLKSSEVIIHRLEKLKYKVKESEHLSEEEAQEILNDIDSKIEEIENARVIIENLDGESTPEEIKEAANIIRETLRKINFRLKVHSGKVVNERIGGIIVKSKRLEAKLERVVTKLKDKGYDVSKINGLVSEFHEKITEAGNLHQEARNLFLEAKQTNEPKLVKEAHEKLKESHKTLKEAHKLLKEIVHEIKETKEGEKEIESEDEVEEQE